MTRPRSARWRWALALGVLAASAVAQSEPLDLEGALRADWDTLDVAVVTPMPEDRKGGRAIVLLHGYGGKGPGYEALADAIVDGQTRVFLPTAVLPHPRSGGAMWWEFIEEDWPWPYAAEDPPADPTRAPSRQLPRARKAVLGLLAEIRGRYRPDSLVIVGHSQGGMLALDVAASVDPPLDRLAVIAGYLLRDTVPRLAQAPSPRPRVLVSHGRSDGLVPFERAKTLRRVLEENGYPVTFAPHDGGHGIDAVVVRDLRRFLNAP